VKIQWFDLIQLEVMASYNTIIYNTFSTVYCISEENWTKSALI